MRTAALLIALGLTTAACQPAEPDAPTPAEQVSAAPPKSDAETVVPPVLDAAQLRQVCEAGLANIHGQTLSAIQIDGLEGEAVNASWAAPVDGGRRRAQCRVDGDRITWRPADAGSPEQARWMNQAGDPETRFALDGERITITTTLPDGTTAAETYSTANGQEAR